MTRILIADDHRLLRDALRRLLEAEADLRVCGEAADGSEVVRQVHQLQPDVLLLDISMPEVSGIDALRALDGQPSRMRVLLLTAELPKLLEVGDTGFRNTMWELAILVVMILVLVISVVLLRRRGDRAVAEKA